MSDQHRDWSRETLRASRRVTVEFPDIAGPPGAVARARFPVGPDRPLTVEEVTLLAALKSPRVLPRALYEQLRDGHQVVGRMVLDGLIEVHRDGHFQSGVSAFESARASDGTGRGSVVSDLALRYAVALRHMDPSILAERLYAFNSLPRAAGPREDAAHAFTAQTGIDAGSPSPRIGGREWLVQPGRGWLYFRRGTPEGNRFKVYLCPRPDDMPRVIPGFAEVLGRARSAVFKIAFPAGNCVRADKIVTYFPTFQALQQTVSSLARIGLEAEVQALPFSAPVPGTPLLSWGVDPPNLASQKASSWRSWLTRQVAACAHQIPSAAAPEAAFDHLQAALRLRDIDPVSWLPRQELLSRKWSLEI